MNEEQINREIALVVITLMICFWIALVFYLGTIADLPMDERIISSIVLSLLFVLLPVVAGYKLSIHD